MINPRYGSDVISPYEFPDFKTYWRDHGCICDFLYNSRNIIWRIRHRWLWRRFDGFMWMHFLFYSNPMFPRKFRSYVKYRRGVAEYRRAEVLMLRGAFADMIIRRVCNESD